MHEKSRLLIKGTSVYTLTSILTQAGAILLLPVYTRLLSPEQYGIIGLITPLINFIPLFFIFGLYVAQMRMYADYSKTGEMGKYILTINVFLIALNSVFFLFLISPPGNYLLDKLFDFGTVPYHIVLIAAVIGFIKVFNQMGNNYFRTIYDLKRVAYANIMGFIISNASGILLIVLAGLGVMGKYWGMLAGTVFMFILLYVPYIMRSEKGVKFKYLKVSLLIGLPVMLNSITSVIINYSDRIVIAKHLPIEVVGVYSIAYTGGLFLSVFIASFNSAWIPLFNELMTSQRSNRFDIVKKRFTDFAVILVFFCITGQLFGINIINIALPIRYADTAIYFPFIIFGIVFLGLNHFLTDIIIYHKDTYFLPILTLFSAAINLGFNILLIPRFGPIMAAYTTIAAYLFITVCMLIIVRVRYNEYRFDLIKVMVVLIFAFNPLVFSFAMNDTPLYILFKVVYIGVYAAIFMRSMADSMRMLRRRNEH